jgi:hypothetical protein
MLRRTLLSTLALLLAVTVAPLARADAGAERAPEPGLGTAPSLDVSLDAPRPIVPPTATVHARPRAQPAEAHVARGTRLRWYGYQIIATDLAALVTSAASPGYGSLLYLSGGPFVHLLHGNYAEAAGSAGLRLGLPVAGLHLGLLAPADSGWDELGNMLRGAMLGSLSAVVIDSAIAFKRVPVKTDRLAVTPVVGGSSEGAVVGLAGAF